MISRKLANILILIGYGVLVLLLVLVLLQSSILSRRVDVGCQAVNLLYDFSTPRELVENQTRLQELLTEEEFERLTVDNDLRVVNAYYKFGYSESKVTVLEYSEGYVLYQILNSSVDKNVLWVFQYDKTPDGKLTNIREYRTMNIVGTEGMR